VVPIEGETLHFLHARGRGKTPVPLLMANGWPSNFYELLPLIPRLIEEKDGICFDVIIASLPGYGFSEPPRAPGVNLSRIGERFALLMTNLGYDRFMVHGSDLGAGAVQMTALLHPDRVMAMHHCNVYWNLPKPPDASQEEKDYFQRGQAWAMQEGAYGMIQATKPQTLAFGLADSPAGMAAWIVEKFRTWSDCDGDVEKSYSLDTLCTLLTIYWVTGTIGSSMRLYAEVARDPDMKRMAEKTRAPVAVAMFPKDLVPAPRAFGERWLNLKRWTEMPRGGHFAALEQPDLLADDIRAFAAEAGVEGQAISGKL
jgi:pimeloyl-ACP methyl ester carboxylesterase